MGIQETSIKGSVPEVAYDTTTNGGVHGGGMRASTNSAKQTVASPLMLAQECGGLGAEGDARGLCQGVQ